MDTCALCGCPGQHADTTAGEILDCGRIAATVPAGVTVLLVGRVEHILRRGGPMLTPWRDEAADAILGVCNALGGRDWPPFNLPPMDVQIITTASPAQVLAAREKFHEEGRIEIDEDARTSEGEDGTWVAGWLWIGTEGSEE